MTIFQFMVLSLYLAMGVPVSVGVIIVNLWPIASSWRKHEIMYKREILECVSPAAGLGFLAFILWPLALVIISFISVFEAISWASGKFSDMMRDHRHKYLAKKNDKD